MIQRRIVLSAAGGLTAALALTACSGSSGKAASTNVAGKPSSTASSATGTAQGGHTVSTSMLMAKQTKALGTVVTDHEGNMLYRYDKDMASPSMSMCTGACAKTWMPVAAEGTPTVQGVNARLVGTFTRSDGMNQITLAGWPLYRYMGDAHPGDSKGQGVGGTWHVIRPSGKKVKASAAASSSGGGGKATAMPSMSGMGGMGGMGGS